MDLDRRRHEQPTELIALLEQLPARVLLDRIPGPVLGVANDGVVAYANPAAVALFGYVDGAMHGLTIHSLLAGGEDLSTEACLGTLRVAGDSDVVDWTHSEGYRLQTAVSTPLLLRDTDPFLMVSITDVTDLNWG
jgi:PAS domain-containing protein